MVRLEYKTVKVWHRSYYKFFEGVENTLLGQGYVPKEVCDNPMVFKIEKKMESKWGL